MFALCFHKGQAWPKTLLDVRILITQVFEPTSCLEVVSEIALRISRMKTFCFSQFGEQILKNCQCHSTNRTHWTTETVELILATLLLFIKLNLFIGHSVTLGGKVECKTEKKVAVANCYCRPHSERDQTLVEWERECLLLESSRQRTSCTKRSTPSLSTSVFGTVSKRRMR